MKFIDLFAGIGGFRTGMEMNGHECVAFCEIDKFARQSYKAIYDTEGEEEWHDITEISIEEWRKYKGTVDIICGGFPCQAFSIAGKRGGFDDTRGTLFFDIARAAKEIEPSYLFLENVKGLFSHDKGRTFGTIIQALDELGYITEWGLFNSKFWGVPQNRERVFIVATRKDVYEKPILFDLIKQQTEVSTRLIDVLETDVDEKYFLPKEKTSKLILNNEIRGGDGQPKISVLGNTSKTGHGSMYVYDVNGISPTIIARDYKGPKQIAIPCLTPDRIEKRQNGRRFKEDGEPMFTLTAQDRHGVAIMRPKRTEYGKAIRKDYESGKVIESRHNMTKLEPVFDGISNTITTVQKDNLLLDIRQCIRIRKLTPLECWRLQGFTDEQFYKAKNAGVSDSQLYKQAGNSVTVNVVDAIARKL